jgi:membrane-bound lytic murein transglycosylase D
VATSPLDSPVEQVPEETSEQTVAVATATPEPVTDLWERIRRQLSWQTIHNSQVGQARDRFLKQPDYLPVVSERGNYYLYYIVEEVERRGMPMEILLVRARRRTLADYARHRPAPGAGAGLVV